MMSKFGPGTFRWWFAEGTYESFESSGSRKLVVALGGLLQVKPHLMDLPPQFNMGNGLTKSCWHPWFWFVGLFALTASMAVVKYYTLHTAYLDLGIFQYNLANISTSQWWRAFGGHAQPFLLPWAFLYQSLPESLAPAIILILQAAILALPVVVLGRVYGRITALAYCLYFPVWYNALFDFHVDHMATAFLFAFFFLEKANHIRAAVGMALLLALVKENYTVQAIFCGLYLVLFRKKYLAGCVLILCATAYLGLVIQYLIPYIRMEGIEKIYENMPVSSAFGWLGANLVEGVWFVLTQPHLVFAEIVTDSGKLHYLLYTLGALGFVSLLRPRYIFVAIPVFGPSLLSQEPNHSGFMNHYTAGLIAPLVMGFSEGLPDAKRLWKKVGLNINAFLPVLIAGLVVCHILSSPSPIGRKFWLPLGWHYHFTAYEHTDREIMIKNAISHHIPSDKNLMVSTQNSLNWGPLAHRNAYNAFPNGVAWPHLTIEDSDRTISGLAEFIKTGKNKLAKAKVHWADYIVIDLKRPWYIVDQDCDWYEGKCRDQGFVEKFMSFIEQIRKSHAVIFENDGFMIFKRLSGEAK